MKQTFTSERFHLKAVVHNTMLVTPAKEVMSSFLLCLSAELSKIHLADFHETWRRGVAWANKEAITFLSGSES